MEHRKTHYLFLAGGFFLALTAGQVNVISIVGVYSQTVSHLSGNVAHLSISTLSGEWTQAGNILLIILHFAAGAALSGLITGSGILSLGRRYGVLLMLEGSTLYLSMVYLSNRYLYGEYLAASAMGLQNAMASSFSGAVLRTTHMTGVITDLGILIGHFLRTGKADFFKLWIYLSLLTGFLTGGIAGSFAYSQWRTAALLLPAGMTFLAGIVYFIWKQFYSEKSFHKKALK